MQDGGPCGSFEKSEERRKPPPPLLLEKVSQYTSNLYCNMPPMCIVVLSVLYALRKGNYYQYSSHLYRSTPPICIAIRLPFVSQYFWENPGGCGHQDVAQKIPHRVVCTTHSSPAAPKRLAQKRGVGSNRTVTQMRIC